ncbi:hypothetical protein [Rufibacter roseus]|uniref:Uncharacterized protein n=1 Tax=Rufibacter roseus TaxID=1567108 RepID=A0ABW2DTW6_9BACT|nr:hypothetical protein [Rufibacter roseus]
MKIKLLAISLFFISIWCTGQSHSLATQKAASNFTNLVTFIDVSTGHRFLFKTTSRFNPHPPLFSTSLASSKVQVLAPPADRTPSLMLRNTILPYSKSSDNSLFYGTYSENEHLNHWQTFSAQVANMVLHGLFSK